MAEKPKMPNATAGARRRKRAEPPTIDLTATEVSSAHAADQPAPQAAAKPVPSDPPPAAPEQPAAEHELPPLGVSAADERARGWSAYINGPTLAAGLAGAGMITLVLYALWLTGLVPIRYAGSTATRARVTALEMEVHDLKGRPAGAADSRSAAALNERIGKVEAAMAKLAAGDAGVAERMTAAENANKSLGTTLAALNRRGDDIAINAGKARESAAAAEKAVTELRASLQDLVKDAAKNASAGIPSAELDALQRRIAALERSAKLAREELAETAAKTAAMVAASDRPARLALSAAALRDAVLSGAPFTAELAQVKSLAADDKTLVILAAFAAAGVPAATALAQELRALMPAMLKASDTPAPPGGFIERLQANAAKLVRIRPVDAPPGDDVAAVLARIEIAAGHADIAAALADLGKLPDAVRALAQGWIAKAQNRQAALTAARQLAADSARALAPKAGAQ